MQLVKHGIIEKILYKFGYVRIDRVHEIVDPMIDKCYWISELNRAVDEDNWAPIHNILKHIECYVKLIEDMENMVLYGKQYRDNNKD